MGFREAPWSAVAAATAFPPIVRLPYEPQAEGGGCCRRTPRRVLNHDPLFIFMLPP